jgi:hypothetical protein
MSANSSLAIRIATIFDSKGLKQAGKEVKGLQGAVKKLAGAAGIGLSTAAVINFGKNAAKAFIADEKAASQLAQAVKNLGLSFEVPRIEAFISQLSKASGVTDDVLRPSMQKLLQTTGSVTKSQDLLTQALDISRGSGVDYNTVVEDLTKAYTGQTRGIGKYKLGLTQAELKTMSFADIQEKLSKQFSGANAAYLETYAGKMGILSTAAGEATEIIGKGLVDSLSILAGDGNTVQPLADSMEMLATEISSVITGLAEMIAYFKELPGMDFFLKNIFPKALEATELGKIVKIIKMFNEETNGRANRFFSGGSGGVGFNIEEERTRRRIEAESAKRNKELAALQKKSLDAQKKSLALQKASKTLNLDAIGIEAALKGKISETDRISLLLQKAILEGNASLATQLSDMLEAAIKRQNELRLALLATPKAPNPYADWKIPVAGRFSPDMNPNDPTDFIPANPSFKKQFPGMVPNDPPAPVVNVKVEVAGEDVAAIITGQQTNQSLSGSFVNVNRQGRFAETPTI